MKSLAGKSISEQSDTERLYRSDPNIHKIYSSGLRLAKG
jgi:hypothetical protein